MWCLLKSEGRRILVVKGAPEDLSKLSSRYELSGERDTQPFDAAALARAPTQFQTLCTEGFRVLGIAWREEPASPAHVVVSDEHDLCCWSPVTPGSTQGKRGAAIAALERSSVGIKIITGDNERARNQYVCPA